MENQPANTAQISHETYYDMALYMEALFALYGIDGILADDIIHCIDKGYVKAMKNLKGNDPPKPPIPAIIPVGKSTWWNGVRSGRYPPGVKISSRCTAWRVEDIRKLIESQQ